MYPWPQCLYADKGELLAIFIQILLTQTYFLSDFQTHLCKATAVADASTRPYGIVCIETVELQQKSNLNHSVG
jgi:hypothetical protein